MSKLDPLLERNLRFAESRAFEGVSIMPRIPVFLVTCLDPRVDPAAVFGVELGDVASVRNAGGRVTDAVIEDVAFISFMVEQLRPEGELFEVAIVHHSECGTGFLADSDFRSRFALRSGLEDQHLADEAVTDPFETVRLDVARLASAPSVSRLITIAGYVHDLSTGRVELAVGPVRPREAVVAQA
jgi:carbonic anhydrase